MSNFTTVPHSYGWLLLACQVTTAKQHVFGSVNMFLLKNMKEFRISQYKFHLVNYEDLSFTQTQTGSLTIINI